MKPLGSWVILLAVCKIGEFGERVHFISTYLIRLFDIEREILFSGLRTDWLIAHQNSRLGRLDDNPV
jgi:hypothetical protein